jgi:predicted ATPase/Tfp pilus assembly protein PilF
MAVHLGEATPVDGDYLAPCLNRLARLLATGYGGQVLLSDDVRRAVEGNLPDDVSLRDLGRHRLRDLIEPVQVAQLVIAGLPDHFPPLKSLERHPTNLPVQPNPLVGRESELAAVTALLGREDVRLITLTGMGGIGKTRLALQVAADTLDAYEDGGFVVDLAPLADASLVLPTIAATLGVRESGGLSLRDALVAHLAEKRLLLVLDNFEQVLGAAGTVADLLSACAGLTVIVTSRAKLGLRAEHEYPVAPLPTPDLKHLPSLAALAENAAVALFVQRATAARHDFVLTEETAALVAAICARLDGLPLAIELAAARIKTLPPWAILARLTNRLKLLTGGARDLPARQQTLRAAIEWSHELLPEDDRVLFRRLAVFAGGFSLEAAETVVGDDVAVHLDADVLDGVEALVNQSLLRQAGGLDGEPRFTMLETLREFGLERLEDAGEGPALRRAQSEWCLALAQSALPHLTGPEQAVWLARLEIEHDNLRAALASTDDDGDRRLRLAAALWRFWYMRGHISEGRAALAGALAGTASTGAAAPATPARATALNGSGLLAYVQGDYAHAVACQEEGLALWRELGDKAGIATSLYNLGLVADARGEYARAAALFEESLAIAREAGDTRSVAAALHKLGTIVDEQGDYARAVTLYEESLAILRTLGDQRSVAVLLDDLGLGAFEQGDYARAAALHGESLAIERRLDDPRGVATSLNNLGNVAYEQGDYARAMELHAESLAIERTLGNKRGVAASLNNLGLLAHRQGDYTRAVALQAECLEIMRELGDQSGLITCLEDVAGLTVTLASAEQAARLFGAAAALREALGVPAVTSEQARIERSLAEARAHLGESALAEMLAIGRTLSVDQAVAEALSVLRQGAVTRRAS